MAGDQLSVIFRRCGADWFEIERIAGEETQSKAMVSIKPGDSVGVGVGLQLRAVEGQAVSVQKNGPRMVALDDVIERLEQGFGKGCAPVTTLLHHFKE